VRNSGIHTVDVEVKKASLSRDPKWNEKSRKIADSHFNAKVKLDVCGKLRYQLHYVKTLQELAIHKKILLLAAAWCAIFRNCKNHSLAIEKNWKLCKRLAHLLRWPYPAEFSWFRTASGLLNIVLSKPLSVMVFLLRVWRLPVAISRFVSRNRILREATFNLATSLSTTVKTNSLCRFHGSVWAY